MKLKTMMIAAMAAVVGLAACSKEDGPGKNETGEDKTVSFVITKGGEVVGRAAGPHVGSEGVTINDAYIYFTDASDNIMLRVFIDQSDAGKGQAYNSTAKTVGYEVATTGTGATITNVPGTTTKVYIIGNLNETYPTSGNIKTLFNTADTKITVASQYDATATTGGGVDKVTLYGTKGLELVDAGTNKYKAEVDVKPIVSRFEIGRITGKNAGGEGGNIVSFDLEGIFINKYYPSMTLDGSSAATLKDNEAVNANYTAAGYAGLDKIVSDYTAAALVGQAVAAPYRIYGPVATADAEDDVWGYNLLAPASAVTPNLIIHVKNVVVKNNGVDDALSYAGDKYLTVQFGAGTNEVTVAPGKIFRIKDLAFSETDLTDTPYQKPKTVDVIADFMDWVFADIDYSFN